MLVHPRVALASGLAAAAAAALMLLGRIDGSIVTVVALAVVARAAAVAAAGATEAPAVLGRQIAAIPAWVAVAIAGVLRISSTSIDGALGANAVAGPAILNGDPLMVVGSGVALAAGILAVVSGWGATRAFVSEMPLTMLEAIGTAVQVLALAVLFVVPQVTEPIDAVVWVVAVAVIGGVAWVARPLARWDWVPRAALGLGVVAVVLTALGTTP